MKKSLIPAVLLIVVTLVPASFAQSPGLATDAEPGEPVVILHTKSGEIVIEFFPDDAPEHVRNFLELSRSGFYDGTVFHRIIEGFMIQGGDPLTREGEETIQRWGTGGSAGTINAEFNSIRHDRGIVSMARSADPNSAGSQFFIVHSDSNFLDGAYTIFGRLATQESFVTLDAIAAMDTPASLQGGMGSTVPINWQDAEIEMVEIVDRANVPDLMAWSEPERTTDTTSVLATSSSEYSNDELGISFTIPEGWDAQSGWGTGPDAPDLVIMGPIAGAVPASIHLVTSSSDGRTLDEFVAEGDELIRQLVEGNRMEIISDDATTLGERDAYVRNVVSSFVTNTGATIAMQFKETTTLNENTFFVITYTADAQAFDQFEDRYDALLDTVAFGEDDSGDGMPDSGSDQPGTPAAEAPEDGGGCLIATAAFGTEMAPQIQQLRELRDDVLLQTGTGQTFMTGFNQLYYSFSPAVADLEREHPAFRELVRVTITPLVSTLYLLNHAEINSEAEMLGYGMGVILLSLGLYVGVPGAVIYQWRRYHTSSTASKL